MTRTAEATRPPGPARISFRWINLLFIHWPIDPGCVKPLLPDGLHVDTCDGSAWIGLVPFTMTHIRRHPFPPLPGASHIHECNVRTYVTCHGEPGVYFFSLDASHRAACAWARRFWFLNYVHAAVRTRHQPTEFRYELERVGDPSTLMRCTWKCGDRLPASQAGTLDFFLTERYAMFTPDHADRMRRGRIWHRPWTLREATLLDLDDRLLRANGLDADIDTPPRLLHCDELYAEAWPLDIVQR